MIEQHCVLCANEGGASIWSNQHLRVVLVDDIFATDYPAFTRVIWQQHVREMSDLSFADRAHLMAVVWAVEQVQREILQPDKINLASFGNMMPHLHWHIIPRYIGDAHWPNPIWGVRIQNEKNIQPIGAHISAEQLAIYSAKLLEVLIKFN